MDTIKFCPQSPENKYLNPFERGQIALLVIDGLSPYAIAKKINRSANTIRSEILRGSVSHIKHGKLFSAYFPDVAGRSCLISRKLCRPKFMLLTCASFIVYSFSMFQVAHFSFDAICGRPIVSTLFPKPLTVSAKTLYIYVDQGLLPI